MVNFEINAANTSEMHVAAKMKMITLHSCELQSFLPSLPLFLPPSLPLFLPPSLPLFLRLFCHAFFPPSLSIQPCLPSFFSAFPSLLRKSCQYEFQTLFTLSFYVVLVWHTFIPHPKSLQTSDCSIVVYFRKLCSISHTSCKIIIHSILPLSLSVFITHMFNH